MSSMILSWASESPSSALMADTLMIGGVVTGELVLVEELTHLHLDELEELFVVDGVDLVESHHDGRHADLTGEHDVLTGLGGCTLGGVDHEDRTVDLGRTGDHVLDVVGVAGHVDVGVVTAVGLVLDVGDVDGDAALTLLGGLVDVLEGGRGVCRGTRSASVLVIAAVNVVLPWST